jgi:hypothetical protein
MKEKIAFSNQEEAMSELRRIIDTNYQPWKKRHTKPNRVYQDPKNKMWYLTSKPNIIEYDRN